MNLFEIGGFTLPSGKVTDFKIECDALMDGTNYKALAALAVKILPPFGYVEGVARGGVPFAEALEAYVTPGVTALLIADDVWVTGLSMNRHRQGRNALGIVAFARNPVDWWVKTLFQMNPEAEKATYGLIVEGN